MLNAAVAPVPVETPYASTATPPGAAFVGAFLALGFMLLLAANRLCPSRREVHARYTAPRR